MDCGGLSTSSIPRVASWWPPCASSARIMVGSASEVVSIKTLRLAPLVDPASASASWLAVGAGGMTFVAGRADYRTVATAPARRPPRHRGSIGLVLVLVPHLGVKVTGSCTMAPGFGSFDIQPSEIMKLALAIFGADLIVRRRRGRPGGAHHHRPGPGGHGRGRPA